MSQNGTKRKADGDKKPVFVRGIKPSTKDWLESKVDRDSPSVPKVVKRIVEEEHRREIERKRNR